MLILSYPEAFLFFEERIILITLRLSMGVKNINLLKYNYEVFVNLPFLLVDLERLIKLIKFKMFANSLGISLIKILIY